MNQTLEHSTVGSRWRVPIAFCLAMLTGTASLSVAFSTSWQRGATMTDRWLLAGVNIIAVLAAQLLPALGQELTVVRKCVCAGLWLTCIAYTVQGQAGFLLAAQERGGLARAQAVTSSDVRPTVPGRDLPTILYDKARIAELLAHVTPWSCDDACATRTQLKRTALTERLKALDAEAQAAEDRRREQLQVEQKARQAEADLVGTHLADTLGVSYGAATGIIALTFALILEGVGCFCWSLVLKAAAPTMTGAPGATTAAAGVVTEVESHDVTPSSHEDHIASETDPSHAINSSGRSLADDAARVAEAVRDFKIALKVIEVRRFLGCSQRRASEVRRKVGGLLLPTLTRD